LGPERPVDMILKSRDGLVRPWSVRILYETCHTIREFWLSEWRWLIPRLIAIVAIIVGAVLAIYYHK